MADKGERASVIAIDTNVLLRLIIGDDEEQLREAQRLGDREPLYVSLTVLLETVWVLRSRYDFDRARIGGALSAVHALKALAFEKPEWMPWLIANVSERGDIADLFHLIAIADSGLAFATFDKAVASAPGSASPAPVVVLSAS